MSTDSLAYARATLHGSDPVFTCAICVEKMLGQIRGIVCEGRALVLD